MINKISIKKIQDFPKLSRTFCALFRTSLIKSAMGAFGSIFIANDVRRMTPSISAMNTDSTKRRRNSSSPGCFHTHKLHDSPITGPPPLPPRIQPMRGVGTLASPQRKRMVLTDIHKPLEMAHSQRTILSILQSKHTIHDVFEQPSNSV